MERAGIAGQGYGAFTWDWTCGLNIYRFNFLLRVTRPSRTAGVFPTIFRLRPNLTGKTTIRLGGGIVDAV